MPRKYELTWDKSSKRWKKFYRGKQYYFPFGESKTDVAGYLTALDAWQAKKREIDQAPEDNPGLRKWDQFIAEAYLQQRACQQRDTPENRHRWMFLDGLIGGYKRMRELGIPHDASFGGDDGKLPIMAASSAEDENPPPWDEFRPALALSNERTVGGNIDRFLKRKQEQAERGERSHGHFDVLRCCLENFRQQIGGTSPVEHITGPALVAYREYLLKQIEADKISPHYARSHLASVKQFVRWCWEQDLVELPRILQSREFTIALPEKRIEVFTVDEVEQLLGAATESTKLYLLLMLNCGMTQQDIADLKQAEVDWERGRVIRKRSKTDNHKSVPEVSYPLWSATFALLKQHRSKDKTLALTNRNGTPLKTEEIVAGKVKKIDNVRSAFNRVVRKLKTPALAKKPLKLLRKTSASMLGGHPEFGKFAQYFLGHSPQTVADKHYVRPSDEQFSRAVQWLGEQYSIKLGTTDDD